MALLNDQEAEFFRRIERAPAEDNQRGEHRAALREQALAAFDRAAQAPPVVIHWKRAFDQGREIMRRPIPRLLAISAACVAVLALWILAPGGQSTAHAFHRFADAILDAKSARFEMQVDIEGQPKRDVHCYYLSPGRYRYEFDDTVSVADFREAKTVTLLPKLKQAVIMNMTFTDQQRKRESLDTFGRLRELLADLRDAKDDEYERLGEKEIDGQPTVGFRHETSLGSVTMWGDPETGMPVLVETIWTGLPPTVSTMTDFNLDVDLKPDLFALTIPKEYKVQTFDADASPPVEADLINALRTISDKNDGEFLDALNMASVTRTMIKMLLGKSEDAAQDNGVDMTRKLMQLSMTIGRGVTFAMQLPDSADAHYAGKGVKRDEPNRPVFWYKPEGSEQYRVIFADLSVKAMENAPRVPGAEAVKTPTQSPARNAKDNVK
jgi:outer membrane lipoprotein-sorting protein